MMINVIRIKITPELQSALNSPGSVVNTTFIGGIEKSIIHIQGEVKKNIVPGWGMGYTSKFQSYFTGKLNRSVVYVMSGLKGILGANTAYDAIQEEGGDIRPKTAKALFIPLSSRGRKVGPQKGGGSGLVYGKDFIFMQKVTIKPKHYFQRGIDSGMPRVLEILKETVQEITKLMGFK